jgi:hypothetical protein
VVVYWGRDEGLCCVALRVRRGHVIRLDYRITATCLILGVGSFKGWERAITFVQVDLRRRFCKIPAVLE